MPAAALKLRGLVAPVFTPMRDDGSLDLDRVEAQAEHLKDQGVVGVFVAGTTGEGMSLAVAERRQLAERWCAVAGKQLPVIVHVGHNSISEARDLAAHAEKAGAAAIAAVPPSYYAPKSVRDVVACCAEVAAAAPGLPFYYYHIPVYTGVKINVTELVAWALPRVPTLAGLKFSDGDLVDFGRCVDIYGERFDLFFGVDELLLPALSVGATAAIGTTYNFAAPLYLDMIGAFNRGDMATARLCHKQARDLVLFMQRLGGLPAMKAAMRRLGVDCGRCRLPLRDLGPRERETLEAELEEVLWLRRPGRPATL
jgi:N-acetylneuraminate lyase